MDDITRPKCVPKNLMVALFNDSNRTDYSCYEYPVAWHNRAVLSRNSHVIFEKSAAIPMPMCSLPC